MIMQTVLIIIMCISILGVFIESWIVFKSLKNQLHAYLLLSCIATLINNVGYLLEIRSVTEEEFIAALKFSYFGRNLIAFSLLMFAAELCRIKISVYIRGFLLLLQTACYAVILTFNSHSLYYTNYSFVTDGLFPVLKRENGIVHHFFMQLQIIYIILALYWLLRSVRREKSRIMRKRYRIVFCAFVLETVFFLVQISGIRGISGEFDISIVGNVVLTICMYIAIFRYNLLGVTEIARDYMIDRLSEGVIAVDTDGNVQYFNEPARQLYPGLNGDPEAVLDEIRNAIKLGRTIKVNDRIYTPEENDLTDKGESFGKIYALVDSTVLKLREYKLKSDAAILEMAANTMRERLLTTEELMQQDRAMRHDRRHFEALLLSLIKDGRIEEAEKCLEERMVQEPHTVSRYCENTTVNAAITHYISVAENKNITVKVSANIPDKLNVDEMQLAITISNLLENAIHACEKLPAEERLIEIKAKYKEQLLLEITNSCPGTVPLDDEGHPFASNEGHGIGTRSVLAFAEKTDSEIIYIAEEGTFRVRMLI